MIKARYIGIDEGDVLSGRVYKIRTKCEGSNLIVTVRSQKFRYSNLEEFLKSWKVEVVYHGGR